MEKLKNAVDRVGLVAWIVSVSAAMAYGVADKLELGSTGWLHSVSDYAGYTLIGMIVLRVALAVVTGYFEIKAEAAAAAVAEADALALAESEAQASAAAFEILKAEAVARGQALALQWKAERDAMKLARRAA